MFSCRCFWQQNFRSLPLSHVTEDQVRCKAVPLSVFRTTPPSQLKRPKKCTSDGCCPHSAATTSDSRPVGRLGEWFLVEAPSTATDLRTCLRWRDQSLTRNLSAFSLAADLSKHLVQFAPLASKTHVFAISANSSVTSSGHWRPKYAPIRSLLCSQVWKFRPPELL